MIFTDGALKDPSPVGGGSVPVSVGNAVSLANRTLATIYAGQAVMLHISGTGVVLWDGTRDLIGLMAADTLPATAGDVRIVGALAITDWTHATGAATLPQGMWFADPANPGSLTQIPPVTIIQNAGNSSNPTTLDVMVTPSILL